LGAHHLGVKQDWMISHARRSFLESIYRRFDAAMDRIDSRERSPSPPREADVLTQVIDQIKAENFERASELLNALNQAIVA
jgi:CRISPR/Cas system CSM-associated protein Csm2 small subunit